MPSRRSVVRMPVSALEHVPGFVGSQAHAHHAAGLFQARGHVGQGDEHVSLRTCMVDDDPDRFRRRVRPTVEERRIALSSPAAGGSAPCRRSHCRRSTAVARAARPSSRRRPRRSRCATSPPRQRSGARTRRCSLPGTEGGTTGGRARSQLCAVHFHAHDLVVDLLGGQLGEATVRVPVQTDEHPLGSQRGQLVCVRDPWPPTTLGEQGRGRPCGNERLDGGAQVPLAARVVRASTWIVMATFTAAPSSPGRLSIRQNAPHGRQRTTPGRSPV